MQKKLYELKENPLSTAIYGEAEDVSDLAENMKQAGQITPIVIKPDGTIISGHRRYRAARQAGMILVNVEVKTPKDKDEEELWIISANKQREKTPDQLYREGKRLEVLFAKMAREKMSEAARNERAARKAAAEQNKGLTNLVNPSEERLTETPSETSPAEPDIVNIYDEAIARTETAKEPQMRNSAVEASAVKPEEPKPSPIRTRHEVAKALNLSPTTYQRIKTVGDAAEAGVPEAQEAMRQLSRKEITVNKANTMVLQALRPELSIEKPKQKPNRVECLLSAFEDAKQWVFGVIDDIERENPETSTLEARRIIVSVTDYIRQLSIMKEKLFIYIEDKEVEAQHGEG